MWPSEVLKKDNTFKVYYLLNREKFYQWNCQRYRGIRFTPLTVLAWGREFLCSTKSCVILESMFSVYEQQVEVPSYSDLEYQQHLSDDSWSRQETDYLMDLSRKFDLRFIIMHDRWDRINYPNRSIQDMKERYYSICSVLAKVCKLWYSSSPFEMPPIVK